MLNFIDKNGKKVMEMKDNGEMTILNEKLKESFSKEAVVESKEKENQNG